MSTFIVLTRCETYHGEGKCLVNLDNVATFVPIGLEGCVKAPLAKSIVYDKQKNFLCVRESIFDISNMIPYMPKSWTAPL